MLLVALYTNPTIHYMYSECDRVSHNYCETKIVIYFVWCSCDWLSMLRTHNVCVQIIINFVYGVHVTG